MITIRVGWLKVQGRPIMRNCSSHVPLFYHHHHEDHDVDDDDDEGNFDAMCVRNIIRKRKPLQQEYFPARSGFRAQYCKPVQHIKLCQHPINHSAQNQG